MEVSHTKWFATISLFLGTLICSLLPVLLVKKLENGSSRPRYIRVVSFLSCFGGGVFMATCLLHLFPDVKDQIRLIFKIIDLNPNFPVAEFLLSVGFLIVLLTEQIVLYFQEHENSPELQEHKNSPELNHIHVPVNSQYPNYGSFIGTTQEQSEAIDIHISDSAVQPPSVQPDGDHELHTHEVSFHQDLSSHSILRSLLLVFALSLHSVFEGLAIGLQSSVKNVLKILLAVGIHKCVIAFTLGINLANSKLEKGNAVKGIVFFSLTSPLGIIIGLVVVDFVTGLPMLITCGILQGLAAGTFLYVTFFEVLPHELNSKEDRMIKMLCLLLGFSVVSILLILLPD